MDQTLLGLLIIAGVLALPTLWILWLLLADTTEPSGSNSPYSGRECSQTRTGALDVNYATTDVTDINWPQGYIAREIDSLH